MKKIFMVCAVIAQLLVCTPLWALSPPQYSLWRQVNASFGASPFVKVNDMREIDDGHYEIDIQGITGEVSTALAAIIIADYNFGGIGVKVNILNPDGSIAANPLALRKASGADEIRGYFEKALMGNSFIRRIMAGGRNPYDNAFWVECRKKLIQFWNDNIGDYYGNDVYIAADVFRNLVQTAFETDSGSISAGFTTQQSMLFN
jgi:hypothetical protein